MAIDIIRFKKKVVSDLSNFGTVKSLNIKIPDPNEDEAIIYVQFNYNRHDVNIKLTVHTGLFFYCDLIIIGFYFGNGKWLTEAFEKVNEWNWTCLHHKCVLTGDGVSFYWGHADENLEKPSDFDFFSKYFNVIVRYMQFAEELTEYFVPNQDEITG